MKKVAENYVELSESRRSAGQLATMFDWTILSKKKGHIRNTKKRPEIIELFNPIKYAEFRIPLA